MMAKMKGCVCFILFLSFFIAHASDIDRPEYPSAYGMCYGALLGQMKLTGGKLSGQKAVDFYNKWTPYYKQLTEQVKKAGGCDANLSNGNLSICYGKLFSDKRDSSFQYQTNIGFKAVITNGESSANSVVAEICKSLVTERAKPPSYEELGRAQSKSTQSSSGTVTRIDTSTGNISITGYARITVGKSTSVTVNGSRVKDEGDLMVGDRCTVRMESTDLYARNLICSR